MKAATSTAIRTHQAAGSTSALFVGIVTAAGELFRLSGPCATLHQARARLAWIRQRYPEAAILRELRFVERIE